MIYNDKVYGKFEITEPVILDLINSPSLQRLKGIDQYGYKKLWVKPNITVNQIDHSRFAHSMGVYLLLRKYNLPLEEQIAGLIHDVSHSAFSHCIDYVLDVGSEKNHDHQDNLFNEYVKDSEIPGIVSKYGLSLDYILNDDNFPAKERKIPELCADRIDYLLRDSFLFGEIGEKEVHHLLESLTINENNWIFDDKSNALMFAGLFDRMNTVYYSGLPSAIMFRTVGDCLKYSLQTNYITYDDLYTLDEVVLNKIKGYLKQDDHLKLLWNRMNNETAIVNDPEKYDAVVFCKSRIVDPLFKDKRNIKRLSEIERSWAKVLEKEMKPKQYFLRFNN